MEEYRIDMKVRNNLILTKIEERGFASALSFCQATNISYTSLISFLNMKESMFDRNGRIKQSVEKLCKELNCIPEEIFSAGQMETKLKTNKRTIKVNEAEVKFMLQQNDNHKLLEDHYSDEQLSNKVEDIISTLNSREQEVINMRMGLGEYSRAHTLEEIGKKLNLNRERIRQIESRALRVLRHSSRAIPLSEYLTPD